jgi:hypothetical protein
VETRGRRRNPLDAPRSSGGTAGIARSDSATHDQAGINSLQRRRPQYPIRTTPLSLPFTVPLLSHSADDWNSS